ncbi:acetyltransferase-like isoleucine patch superfamily enzyme [Lachnospiraceae bacterium PM6-15]|uniref:hypothetical protein n=1 Tax=Ohessyouella blattaphilus TaxID=2949333 RepID=UPI003E1F144C
MQLLLWEWIVNTGCSIDYNYVVGDFVQVSVGAHIAGIFEIGEKTWIDAGATVSINVNICDGCMIGAGTVVIRDIDKTRTYIGIPVEMKEKGGQENMKKRIRKNKSRGDINSLYLLTIFPLCLRRCK